jgi:glutathione S-transferase
MLTLYDYLPSQNAYKIRLLLRHLDIPYRTEYVSIFEGEGQRPDYLAVNPTGSVPAIRLDDGRVLAESNAILVYLAEGSPYLPDERYARAKVMQWLFFEQNYVEPQIGSLRYWTMTGKLERRPPDVVAQRRAGSLNALRILDRELATRRFIAGKDYSIADMSIFAYSHLAGEANLLLADHRHICDWIDRVQAQEGFLAEMYPYSIDPHSSRELP